jgi:formiminoglutamase
LVRVSISIKKIFFIPFMEKLSDYLCPVALPKQPYHSHQWGNNLALYRQALPDLSLVQLAIIGISASDEGEQNPNAADAVRQQLYSLYNPENLFAVADLGNIQPCPSPNDTQYALSAVVETLLKNRIVPIIISNNAAHSIGQFWGHAALPHKVNMVAFDQKIAWLPDHTNKPEMPAHDNYLNPILSHQQLGDFAHLAHQRPFIDPTIDKMLEKRHFEHYGLGELRPDIQEVEPIVRHKSLLSFNLNAIRQADATATLHAPPAGLSAEEALAIARYAGLSDHIKSVGLYGYQTQLDKRAQTAHLIAQMIWYFVAGFYSRKSDLPENDNKRYLRYIVNFKDSDHEIEFLKSKKTDRWWMRIPSTQQMQGYVWQPCSYNDYQIACHGEIPDRWLKALMRHEH